MIELIGDDRHICIACVAASTTIGIRVRLKGTSFNNIQNSLQCIYNDHILRNNSFVFRTRTIGNAMEITATRNQATRSIGYIPKEVARVLVAYNEERPTVSSIEVRKHLSKTSFYGATVRIITSIQSDRYAKFIKDLEESIMTPKEGTNAKPEESRCTEGCSSTTVTESAGRHEETPTGGESIQT